MRARQGKRKGGNRKKGGKGGTSRRQGKNFQEKEKKYKKGKESLFEGEKEKEKRETTTYGLVNISIFQRIVREKKRKW